MSFLPNATLRQRLAAAIRSGGQGGLTSAQDVRDFLGLLLDELEAAEATPAADNLGNHTATQALDLHGHPLVDATGPLRVEGALHINNGPQADGLLLKGGPGQVGSRAALAFDTTGTVEGNNVGARLAFVDDGAYGAHVVVETHAHPTESLDTTEQVRIQTDGRVGLGTSTPRTRLDVHTSAVDPVSTVGVVSISGVDRFGQVLSLQPPGPNYSGLLGVAYKADGNYGEAFVAGSRFSHDQATQFVILDPASHALFALNVDGCLGLGTEAPAERLEVAGRVKAQAFVGDGSQLTGLSAGARCHATLAASRNLVGATDHIEQVVFDVAQGPGYDPATGRFVAPQAGLYGFSLSLEVTNTAAQGEFYTGLLINNSRQLVLYHSQVARAGGASLGTGYVELELTPADTVTLHFQHDNGGLPYQLSADPARSYLAVRYLGT